MASSKRPPRAKAVESYDHPQATGPMRPDVGTQAQFRKKKPPAKYHYDASLAPALEWDAQNPAREEGEAALGEIAARLEELGAALAHGEANERQFELLRQAQAAADKLKRLSSPFLNWTGKAERLSFDVPTLPLFVHERLSTQAVLETVKKHQSKGQMPLFDLFGDPRRSITDQILRPYQQGKWENRLILGDSLVAMNSLLRYESLGGQVQMIYMDPPYGVKFGSNFQPFVRRRDVKHGDDADMTREPEMVQAYRDTWELGLHSYLTYLCDRLLLCRELLHPSGSVFVQISDENVHHVREIMDEVFGAENFVALIPFAKTSGLSSKLLYGVFDFILWYAKDKEQIKYRQLFLPKVAREIGASKYDRIELASGTRRTLTKEEKEGITPIPPDARFFVDDNLTSQGNPLLDFEHKGKKYSGTYKTNIEGLKCLAAANRLYIAEGTLRFVRYLDDFPATPLTTAWTDIGGVQSRTDPKVYVVQTSTVAIQRCILMTTDPGDLVLDPTCGSGTTAYVAEQWGRRWITMDTSRVPLALARQRLLTATFPYYELKDEQLGPAGGFVYQRKQNKKGEEIGGLVPHVTLKSIANDEPPQQEVLVDRPEIIKSITRITAPFALEATIPTPVDWENDGQEEAGATESYGSFVERMIEVLRRSPVLRFNGTRTLTFKNIRPVAHSLSLSAEGLVASSVLHKEPTIADVAQEAFEANQNLLPLSQKAVAFVFGPENGAVSEKLVYEAGREANAKSYSHLYVIGFAIQPNARELVENSLEVFSVTATYVQATPDLLMGDLLKNMRSSQIFSIAGRPDVNLRAVLENGVNKYQVELAGLDTFDPVTMETEHLRGDDVPAWFLDTDYNNLCFHVHQAFFPRTEAWNNLRRALKADYEDAAWQHLAGRLSASFAAGDNKQIAVKVIDDRGNELLVVKRLEEAAK